MTASTPLLPKSDYESILRIRKLAGSSNTITDTDEQEILRLYRAYIENVWGFTKGCNSCPSSINGLWNKLNQWVIKNDTRFEK